jgi:hypothetical protein
MLIILVIGSDENNSDTQRLNRYMQSKLMKFSVTKNNPNPKIKGKEQTKLQREAEKCKLLSAKYDSVMIKTQKLYEAYDNLEYENLDQRLQNLDQAFSKLKISTSLLQNANKMAFFFVNFYKDFESKILYSSKIDVESDIYKECQQLHKDYDFHALNFDFGEFEHAINGNQILINNYDPENDFNDIRAKLEVLNCEFLNHRNQETDDLKNISAIGPRDLSQMNSIDSGDITGLAYYNDDKNAVLTSSINLNHLDDMNSD